MRPPAAGRGGDRAARGQRRRAPSLEQLARQLHVSPFHLARVFRAHTGFSLHGYRLQLRLRAALARVLDGEDDLAALACELGFASHSHLTDRFRQAFERSPSALRRAAATGCAGELRTIVEAPLAAPA